MLELWVVAVVAEASTTSGSANASASHQFIHLDPFGDFNPKQLVEFNCVDNQQPTSCLTFSYVVFSLFPSPWSRSRSPKMHHFPAWLSQYSARWGLAWPCFHKALAIFRARLVCCCVNHRVETSLVESRNHQKTCGNANTNQKKSEMWYICDMQEWKFGSNKIRNPKHAQAAVQCIQPMPHNTHTKMPGMRNLEWPAFLRSDCQYVCPYRQDNPNECEECAEEQNGTRLVVKEMHRRFFPQRHSPLKHPLDFFHSCSSTSTKKYPNTGDLSIIFSTFKHSTHSGAS